MVNIIQAIILGIVQGITEWLPISSSGHLVIFQHFFNLDVPIFFDIMLHVATLLVIFVVFYKDILQMLKALLKLDFKSEHGKMNLFIIIGSIPTAIIGFVFHDLFESFFSNLTAVAIALLVTGFILYSTKLVKNNNHKITLIDSVLVGIAQGLAIIPGISRSGSTISIGMLLGIKKELVAKFSFLLAIPAIIGATLFEAKDFASIDINVIPLLFGMLSAFIVGYLSLKWLLNLIIKQKFHLFAYYCWTVGILLLIITI